MFFLRSHGPQEWHARPRHDRRPDTQVWVSFTKLRECQPVGVYWYRGRRGGPFDQIGFVVERPRNGQRFVNRPLGEQSAGPWVIEAAPGEFGSNVFADAQHSCNPAWTTISRFYR